MSLKSDSHDEDKRGEALIPLTFERLSALLKERKNLICGEWLDAVHRDKEIRSSERTPEPLLIDHVPELLDQLVELLVDPYRDTVATQEAVLDAQEHGVQRFEQGYDLGEMLQELAIFRSTIIAHMLEFSESDPDFKGPLKRDAICRVHGFIDESSRWSTMRFVFEQQRLLNDANESRLNVLNGVSHELGNALNGINFAARALGKATPEQVVQVQKSIGRGVQFMAEMLDDLRELARLEAGDEKLTLTRFAPLSIAQDIAATYGVMAEEKGLKFSYSVDPTLVELISDERRVKQIVVNFVSNSVKYTAVGEVRLECKEKEGGRWLLSVRDTGIGISPEHQEKIFGAFFRVPSATDADGMGLGLAVATRQVQLLGGTIRVESELGKGCLFEASFPKVLSPA